MFQFLAKISRTKKYLFPLVNVALFTGSEVTKYQISIFQDFSGLLDCFDKLDFMYCTFFRCAKPTPQIELLQRSSFLQKSQGLSICSFQIKLHYSPDPAECNTYFDFAKFYDFFPSKIALKKQQQEIKDKIQNQEFVVRSSEQQKGNKLDNYELCKVETMKSSE